MRKIYFVLLCLLLTSSSVYAQESQCTLDAILDSFEAAIDTNEIDLWEQSYLDSDCSNNAKQGVILLRNAARLLLGEEVAVNDNLVSAPTVYLRLYYHSGRGDNFSLALADSEQSAITNNYGFIRLESIIYVNPQPDTIPLHLYYHAEREDYFSVATPEGISDAVANGYVFVRTEGYIYGNQIPGTIPLKLFYGEAREDYFTAASEQGERDAYAAGYALIRTEGYVLPR